MEKGAPQREVVKAFVLPLRFFCQDNEETSLHNMSDRVLNMNVDQQLKVNGWEGTSFYHDLEAQFYVILINFLVAISAMSNACREMLDPPLNAL